jgi:DNA-binding CsgD family transcriptional regulator
VPDGWPLIGRGAERDEILTLARVGRGVVLGGPAGVGKSRLLDEIARVLEDDDGWHVERVVGTPALSVFPLGAFAFVEQPAAIELGRFPTPLGSMRRGLLDRAAGRSLLLAIDDAHMLDDASASLAYQLAVTDNVVVAATVRGPEGLPEAVLALWKNERCERIELQAIARNEVRQLVEAVLGGAIEEKTQRTFWDATQGNLLFLRELIHDGLRSGSLTNDGMWRWRRPARPPASLRELIGSQIDGLPTDGRRALEFVALAEPLEWSLLETVVAEPDVLDRLLHDGHLIAAKDGTRLMARLSHSLVGDVLRSDLSEVDRRNRFGELLDAQPASTRRHTDLLRLVTWLVDAGREVPPEDLIAAARQTMLADPRRAEELAMLAREAGADREGGVVLAQILMFGNRAPEAEQLLSSIETPGVDDDIAVTVMRANNLTFGLYEPAQAVALLGDLLRRVPDDVPTTYVESQQLPMLLFAGRVQEVVSRASSLLGEAKAEPVDQLRAAIALVPALAVSGRPLAAVETAEAARPLVSGAADELPYAVGQLAAGTILALQWAGRLDDAETIARLGYEHGLKVDSALLRGVSAFQLGLCAYWRGSMQTAARCFEEAVAVMRDADVGFLPSACDHLAAVRAILGLADKPDVVVEDELRFPLYETERVRLAGVIAAGHRDYVHACDCAATAAASARTESLYMQELFAHWDHARWGGITTVARDVERAAAECDGALAPVLAAGARAWRADDGPAVDRAAIELEQLGFLPWAAELSRVAARSLSSAGLRARAATANARADRLVERCDGIALLLSERESGGVVLNLTPREREIVHMATAGVANADIARRLSISVRTVEAHLQHVYDKFDVRSRRELREQFGTGSDVPT